SGVDELTSVCGVARDRDVAIHLKLDSGMGRMGLTEGELPRAVELIRSAPRLRIEAVYTHFANASDPRDPFTQTQIEKFRQMSARISAPLQHQENSGDKMSCSNERDVVIRVDDACCVAARLNLV